MISPKNALLSGMLAIGATSLTLINFESQLASILDNNIFPSMLRGTFDVAKSSKWPASSFISFAAAYLLGFAIAIYTKLNIGSIDFLTPTGKSASSLRLSKLMLLCVLGASLFATKSNIRYGAPNTLPSLSNPIALLIWCEGVYMLTFTSILFTLTPIRRGK